MSKGRVIKVQCRCGQLLFKYFKGGRGRLIKCYLDRIRQDYVGVDGLPLEARPTCPACGEEVEEGDAFCSSCGYALQAPALAAVPVAAPAGPRLVVSASGAEIPLPAGDELFIGREDPISGIYPEVDLTPHGGEDGGVSRRHARIIIEGGNYFVEDLDSTNFTFVNKQKLAPKTRQQVNDGDEIRCGRVAMVLKVA